MQTENLPAKSSSPLALFLLYLLGLYILIKLFGYTFIPFDVLAVNTLSAGTIIWLTINEIRNGIKYLIE